MKKTATVALVTVLVAGCGQGSSSGGPLDVVGAIVTAPIVAPIMFIEARRNAGRELRDRVEMARRNQSPAPRLGPRSREQAAVALEAALARGAVDEPVYWENQHDPNGHVLGGATVLAIGQTREGRPCREVLIETTVEGQPTDWRTRTLCRNGQQWGDVPSPQ